MTTKTSPADRRPELRVAYLLAFDNFATGPDEVAAALDTTEAEARQLLDFLVSSGIVVTSIVNGEERVWQAGETYDSISRRTAIRRFDTTFPKGEPVEIVAELEPEPAKSGATGPRYSEAQIVAGLLARAAGKKNREVAEAAGVKSPNYFAKILKAREAAGESVPSQPKPSRREKAIAKKVEKQIAAALAPKKKGKRTTKRQRATTDGGVKAWSVAAA